MTIVEILKKNRKLMSVSSIIVCAFAVDIAALWPILHSGYTSDDAANSLIRGVIGFNDIDVFHFTIDIIKSWLQGQGRFFPLSFYCYPLFYWLPGLLSYKLLQLTMVLVSSALFSRLIFLVFENLDFSLSLLFLPSVFVQFRNWNDPVLSFHFLLPLMFSLVLLSLIFFVKHLDSGHKVELLLASGFFLCSLLMYEVSLAYVLMFPTLALIRTGKILRSIIKSFPLVVISAVVVVFSIYARSRAMGIDSRYTVQFNFLVYIKSLAGHIVASFPFFYFWAQVRPKVSGWFLDIITHSGAVSYCCAVVLPVAMIKLMTRIDLLHKRMIVGLGGLFLVLPLCIVVLSVKHQHFPLGVGYLPVFCGYAGGMLLLAVFLSWILSCIKYPYLRRITGIGVGFVISFLFLSNSYSNRLIVSQLNEAWLYPRQAVENAVAAGILDDVSAGSSVILLSKYSGWEPDTYQSLFYQFGAKKRLSVVDFSSLNQKIILSGIKGKNMYALRVKPDSHSGWNVSIGKIEDFEMKKNGSGELKISRLMCNQFVLFSTASGSITKLNPAISGDIITRTWYRAKKQGVIDLTRSGFPDFVKHVDGLSGDEAWGKWSCDNNVRIFFADAFPEKLTLVIRASAFGPNAGKPVFVRIGSHVRSFTAGTKMHDYRLEFQGCKGECSVLLTIPQPVSPADLNLSSDTRKIGIGFERISVEI